MSQLNGKPNEKMELWNQVCETDPKHTKHVSQRGGFTSIDATYQLEQATRLWGPYGDRWGVTGCQWGQLVFEDKLTITLDAQFKYPFAEGELPAKFPISADMPFKHGDDHRKKLLTAVTSKALSKLGFGADIYGGKFEDDQYVGEMRMKHAGEDAQRATIFKHIRLSGSADDLKTNREKIDNLRGNGSINKELYDEALQLLEQQQLELIDAGKA